MNTSLRKAAQMALDAMLAAIKAGDWKVDGACDPDMVIKALRARLAQPEPEPVVWMYQDKSTHEVRFQKHMRPYVDHGATYEVPLYTAQPQREWQGLTDEDIEDVCWTEVDQRLRSFARAIEAKLKEKNG